MVTLKSIHEERLNRLIIRKYFDSKYNDELIEFLNKHVDRKNNHRANKTINYIKNIDFSHPGLTSAEYINHPLRVTAIISQIDQNINADILDIALLHNILEVSTISEEELALSFNQTIIKALKALKIDRSLETDIHYKNKYYNDINSLSCGVSIVKAIDKFDNLFLLCLNSNDTIRDSYITEIEAFILPIVKNHIPSLFEYFYNLVQNCKILGHLTKEKSLELYGHDYS